jgi:hypothetical protein
MVSIPVLFEAREHGRFNFCVQAGARRLKQIFERRHNTKAAFADFVAA